MAESPGAGDYTVVHVCSLANACCIALSTLYLHTSCLTELTLPVSSIPQNRLCDCTEWNLSGGHACYLLAACILHSSFQLSVRLDDQQK